MAHLLIARVEKAAQIAAWAKDCKIAEFYMILQDRALVWWESIQDCSQDLYVWNKVKG
jgi:hypothetical protein